MSWGFWEGANLVFISSRGSGEVEVFYVDFSTEEKHSQHFFPGVLQLQQGNHDLVPPDNNSSCMDWHKQTLVSSCGGQVAIQFYRSSLDPLEVHPFVRRHGKSSKFRLRAMSMRSTMLREHSQLSERADQSGDRHAVHEIDEAVD